MAKFRTLTIMFWLLVMVGQTWGEDPFLGRMYGETSVAFAPSGEWLVTGGADSIVRIRDATDGRLMATLVGHERRVTAVAISPDGKTIASGSNDGSVRLWDVKTRALKRVLRAPEFTWGISLAFAPDGQTLAVGSFDGRLRLWEPESGIFKAAWTSGSQKMDVVAYSPDGRTIATAGRDRIVRLWDAEKHSLRNELAPMEKNPVRIAFAHDGSLLAVSGGHTITLHDPQSGKKTSRLTNGLGTVETMAFTEGNGDLVTGGLSSVNLISTGVVLDQGSPRVLREGFRSSCVALAVSPNGQNLALCYLYHRDTGHASFEMISLPSP